MTRNNHSKKPLQSPQVMGILNVTPDSFSDGGLFQHPTAALSQARKMAKKGADIIDVGGQSTRPGAVPISVQQELDRVIPVIRAIHAQIPIRISIDTSHPQVMREAVTAGAGIINDVRALREEGAMQAARELDVPVCLMHMQGEPETMQVAPDYRDVVREVYDFLLARVTTCQAQGIGRHRLLIDPGFGFGKTLAHNLELLSHLDRFVDTGIPVLAGLSRKSMIGAILNKKSVKRRLSGSVAAALVAAGKGVAIVRVHDVGPTVDALKVWKATSSLQ
ncbi:MAG: Dihydropteroate synthase [Candidatus Kentron sp. G]|nr:MAG: Dihydropteroate synthase [Candidatus Kentron sp. G]VFM99663.1 MAG: Dihydropteroate synthase [Candidatus Kentron sp. G]VFN04703.1 MAG: Dihydropteroate synthase [Candidatus Kentron sp. G]